jgi:peptide/nickel transport system substrate-binding protein
MKTLLYALSAALVLIGGSVQAQTPSHLRIGLAEDPDPLDPTTARTYVGRIVFASICDKLFDIDEKLNVVPQLALAHATSPDGKSVIIKLRSGVKFQDGEIFDAESAKFSLERHMTMPGSFRRSELSVVDKVSVIDPLTIQIDLKAPFSPLIAQLTDRAGMMVSPKAAKEAGDKFGLKPVCAGPYKFVERVQQDRIVVEKFADYWDKDKVNIDRITYLPMTNATVRLANLRSGQLDLIERAQATDIPDIRANSKLRLATSPELGYQGLTLNVGKGEAGKLLADKRLSQALEAAIDRKAINQAAFNGEFIPGNQWVSPANPYYQKKFPVPERDIAKAKRLIAETGLKTPIIVDFMIPNGSETQQVAEIIQAMAAEAGFEMKLRVTEFATSLVEAEAGRYQAFILAWSGRSDPDGNIYSFAKTAQPNNYSGFSNPDVDRLLDEARTKGPFAERKAIYEDATGKLMEQGGIIYLYHRLVIIAHTDKLEGYVQFPDGLVRVKGLKLK